MSNLKMYPGDQRGENTAEEPEVGALEALWTFFSSMKTAIVLLLVLAAASIAGTIIEDKKGISIYGTPWYSVLLVLVGVNLLVCSLNRFKLVWNRVFHPDVAVTPLQIPVMMARSETVQTPLTPDAAESQVARALHSRMYKVSREASPAGISVYGIKGRWGLWGPHVSHLSLLVIFAGAIYGNLVGAEGYMTIMENHRAQGYFPKGSNNKRPLGFEIGLNSFVIKHDDKHNPIGYKSDLEVYDGGKPVLRKVVDVNHPLAYKGLSFFQSDYGLSGLTVKVESPTGKVRRINYDISTDDTKEGRKYSVVGNPLSQFTLDGRKMSILVHQPIAPDYIGGEQVNGTMLPINPAVNVIVNDAFAQEGRFDVWGKTARQLGWMPVGAPVAFKGFKVTIERVVSYTGLQVSRNPGLPIVYTGFALMILGVLLSFYVSHKIVRVHLAPSADGASVVMGSSILGDPSQPDKDLHRLAEALAPHQVSGT